MNEVLIVGAGPVGLAMACELWQRGVPARIVEAQAAPGRGSRAVQLHPPTLEILRRLGLKEQAERRGLKIATNQYHLVGGRTLRVVLGADNEPLMLPQEQTSGLLEQALEQLGGKVERSVRVTRATARDGRVSVVCEGPLGTETIRPAWLVAADGVRSTLRDELGVEFAGERVPTDFLLAEGAVEGDFDPAAVHYFLGGNGSIVFAGMPGDRVRISGAIPPGFPATPAGVDRLLDERGPGGLRVTRLDMVGTFTSQERIASQLRVGNCFLVGDAAHTHSPLGGQGLNLGLQDAHNLAWKLAGVVSGMLHPDILDGYESERRQAARQTVRNTHLFLRVFTLGPVGARLRNAGWDLVERSGVLRRWFVPLLAGWRVRYGTAAEGPDRRRLAWRHTGLPAAGTRAPGWLGRITDPRVPFHLVTLGPAAHPVARWADALAARLPGTLAHHHDRCDRRGAAFVLLRADGYVAASGSTPQDAGRAGRLVGRFTAPPQPPHGHTEVRMAIRKEEDETALDGTLPAVLGGFDLTDQSRFAAGIPYDLFARLRREAPVLRHPAGRLPDGEGFWVLTRHADIARASLDPVFSSQGGGGRAGGGSHLEDLPVDSGLTGTVLAMMDNPRHEVFRELLAPSFTGRVITAMVPLLQRRAEVLADRVVAADRVNLVDDYTEPFSLESVALLLGVPADDWPRLIAWVHDVLGFTDRRTGRPDEHSRQTYADLRAYFSRLLEVKRLAPGDDLGTVLAVGELPERADRKPLTPVEREANTSVMLVSGFEQPRNTIAGGLLAFAENPEQWKELRADRSLLPTAIEEVLRWLPANPYNRRTLTRDVDLHGVRMHAGDKVTLWWPSANRDEAVFTEPDRFDIRRDPNPHLSFGHGVHYCLGDGFGRLEIRLALSALLDRVAEIRPAGPPVWAPNHKHTVLLDVPVELVPAPERP